MRKAASSKDASLLEQIPNVGPSLAEDFRKIGIDAPDKLVGQDPYMLYDRLCAVTGTRQDPCVIDVFISAVRFMEGADAVPWWAYTPERKLELKKRERTGSQT